MPWIIKPTLNSLLLVSLGFGSTLLSHVRAAQSISDPASLVLPFIGTTNGGHVFPGPTLPHGMVKAGMDTDSPGNHGGYDANPIYNAYGFSQLHDDGTGGAPPLMNFKLWAFANCSSFEQCPTSLMSRKVKRALLNDGTPDDFASPGYFSSNLSTGIRVELTATRRTAIHRYTFPAGTTHPRMLVDITNDGQQSGQDANMTINPETAQVDGGASFAGSFGPGRYNAFTCVTFVGEGFTLGSPTEFGVWSDDTPVRNVTAVPPVPGPELGALLTFAPAPGGGKTVILARAGVSFISRAQACSNANSEIPDYNFDAVHSANRAQWNELLSRIQVDTTGVATEIVQLFYSSLYRTHISPADYTGENPKWTSTEPYYDSFYCNWDTFRTLYPLMSLHDPVRFAEIVRGMINIQVHEGWLPECRGATVQQLIQGGSNGDPILGEFFVKFQAQAASLNVSGEALYSALLPDAENEAPDWDLQGRQADPWKEFNYIPSDYVDAPGHTGTTTRQASRTVEYAFNDFVISQVAKLLGNTADAQKYATRSENFVNIWDHTVSFPGTNFSGMAQQRRMNGTFIYTDPRHCSVNDPTHSTCYFNPNNHDGFYESSPIVYSQFAPHDNAKLIELQGGPNNFSERLKVIFYQGYFDVTDEPSQGIPTLGHYSNNPGLSTQISRQIIAQSYNTTVSGLPGNDDSGAMGSFAVFLLAGLYPVPATRQILLMSPYFPEISFYNPVFKTTTTIRSKNFSGNLSDGTGGNVFVERVTVNGQPYKSNCYLEWDVFTSGAIVELTLTTDINVTCGTGENALPPSLSTGGFN